jgi:hypothetical protein
MIEKLPIKHVFILVTVSLLSTILSFFIASSQVEAFQKGVINRGPFLDSSGEIGISLLEKAPLPVELSEEVLHDKALDIARIWGLEGDAKDPHITRFNAGQWAETMYLPVVRQNPSIPMFALAIRGKVTWKGFGKNVKDSQATYEGITVVIDAVTGENIIGVVSGYNTDLLNVTTEEHFHILNNLPDYPMYEVDESSSSDINENIPLPEAGD